MSDRSVGGGAPASRAERRRLRKDLGLGVADPLPTERGVAEATGEQPEDLSPRTASFGREDYDIAGPEDLAQRTFGAGEASSGHDPRPGARTSAQERQEPEDGGPAMGSAEQAAKLREAIEAHLPRGRRRERGRRPARLTAGAFDQVGAELADAVRGDEAPRKPKAKTVWPPESDVASRLATYRMERKGLDKKGVAAGLPAARRAAKVALAGAAAAAQRPAAAKSAAAGAKAPEDAGREIAGSAEFTPEQRQEIEGALAARDYEGLVGAYRRLAVVAGEDGGNAEAVIRARFAPRDYPRLRQLLVETARAHGFEVPKRPARERAAATPPAPERARVGGPAATSEPAAEAPEVDVLPPAVPPPAPKEPMPAAAKRKPILGAVPDVAAATVPPPTRRAFPTTPPAPVDRAPQSPDPAEAETADIRGRERASVQRRRDAVAAEIRAARADEAAGESPEVRNLRDLIKITNPPRVKAVFERQLEAALAGQPEDPARNAARAASRRAARERIAATPDVGDAEKIAEAIRASASGEAGPHPSADVARLLVGAGGAPIGTFDKFYETLRAHAPEIVGSVQDYRAEDIIEIVEAIRRGEPGVGVEHLTRTFGIREAATRLLEAERREKVLEAARQASEAAPAAEASPVPPVVIVVAPTSGDAAPRISSIGSGKVGRPEKAGSKVGGALKKLFGWIARGFGWMVKTSLEFAKSMLGGRR